MKYFIEAAAAPRYLTRVFKQLPSASVGPRTGIPKVIDLAARVRGEPQNVGESLNIVRYAHNPIITPGGLEWRKTATFNPGVLIDGARFYMYERAAGSLRPFRTCI